MSIALRDRAKDRLLLIRLAARIIGGRFYWILPALPLIWPAYQIVALLAGWQPEDFNSADVQGTLIGFPLTVLAIALGVRVIAGEIDRRTLEIAYTVPGGAHQVWLAKLAAALALLVVAELLLAVVAYVFFTGFPWGALYGALQAAVFYLVVSMALSALFKSEAVGALTSIGLLALNGPIQGGNLRISPFWNPERLVDQDPADVLAWATQNRIGFLLAIAAVVALAFARAERREKLLGG